MTTRRLIGSALALQWRAAPVASSVAVALTIATGSLSAVSAWLTKALLDELGPAGDPARAIAFAIAGAIAAAVAVVSWRMCQHLDSIIRARITTAGARELYGAVVRIDGLRHFDDPAFHTRLRLADEAARAAPQQLVSLLQTVLRTAIALASLAAIVVAVWPPLGLLLVATGSLSVIAQLFRLREDAALRSRLARSGRRIDGLRFALTDPRSAKEIRLLDSGDWLCDRMLALIDREGRAQVARERSAALIQIGLGVVGALVVAIGTVVVVGRVTAGQLALGDVALVTAAAAGVQSVCAGLASELGRAGPTLVAFRAYLDVLAIAPEHPGDIEAPPLVRGIELRDVWFRYRDDGPWVLAGVNLVLPAGSSTGLVGVNGAGKSTLIKLLARFYDVDRGAILWDGIDIRRLDPRSLRRRFAATFQDFVAFELSAAENIGIGDLDAVDDLERIRAAAREVDIDAVLGALPDGYATILGQGVDDASARTTTLSGGQWQRVAVARTLMRRDADVVVLDEPTSGIDAAGEQHIHTLLARHAAGRTRLLVSHRLNALRDADTIAILDDGRIVEQGSHAELMRARGSYARLFTVQAAGYQLQEAS